MSHIRGKTVLITGGASGLGRLMGRRFLDKGAAHLVLWDVQEEALEHTVADLTVGGHRITGLPVDLADPDQIRAAVDDMEAREIGVDLLINNAGIVVGKRFVDHDFPDITRSMEVNALAPMYVANRLLPGMIARRGGHIVNIASAAALVSNPKMSVYCASKWAMAGWSDSLRIEMEQADTGVKVITVMPYYIDTGMFAGVRSRVLPILKPDKVVEQILGAIESDRIFLRLPWLVNFVPLMRAILPVRWFDRIAGDWFGIYRSMDDFRGRQ
jgi:Short-chain dehydrogenases of various substrate specificities